MRVLVTGSSGLLGLTLIEVFNNSHEVIPTFATKRVFEQALHMDICDEEEVRRVLRQVRPEVIVHAAAMTDVDGCEVDRECAWLTNVVGTENLAKEARELGCKLIYISTDYVFDGKKGMYTEEDKPNPINYYGLTKLEGEKKVMEHCEDYLIIRTSGLYGWHPYRQNFVTWLIKELEAGKVVKVVEDQYYSPTYTAELAKILLKVVNRDEQGLIHVAGERLSRLELAGLVAVVFGLDSTHILPVSREAIGWRANRPRDSSLNTSKLKKLTKTLSTLECLRQMRDEGIGAGCRQRN